MKNLEEEEETEPMICSWCDKEIEKGQLYVLDILGDPLHFNCASEIEDIDYY